MVKISNIIPLIFKLFFLSRITCEEIAPIDEAKCEKRCREANPRQDVNLLGGKLVVLHHSEVGLLEAVTKICKSPLLVQQQIQPSIQTFSASEK